MKKQQSSISSSSSSPSFSSINTTDSRRLSPEQVGNAIANPAPVAVHSSSCEMQQTSSGGHFWRHTVTGETSWQCPPGHMASDAAASKTREQSGEPPLIPESAAGTSDTDTTASATASVKTDMCDVCKKYPAATNDPQLMHIYCSKECLDRGVDETLGKN
jgi:hypothetical protein